jgi:hypothetical protein
MSSRQKSTLLPRRGAALSPRGAPFVYSTANTDHGSTNGYSGRPVLRKPFKFEELVAMLTQLASAER